MTGAQTEQEALILQKQIIEMLQSAGFMLHKWVSNSQTLLHKVSQETSSQDLEVKTLGLIWCPNQDKFKFVINTASVQATTKRDILSQIARIFDPLGLLGPTIVIAKLVMQDLWKEKVGWDEQIANLDLLNTWTTWINQLPQLQQVEIPRCIIGVCQSVSHQIHGFSDASQVAYGAVVYLLSEDSSGARSCELISSKSRFSPIKTQSLPRLELNGALILARLLSRIISSLEMSIPEVHLWTDSTIVLSWLAATPNRWKTYVANRVAEIQDLTSNYQWAHVPSELNPVDALFRGIHFDQLQNMTQWWHGPDYLLKGKQFWPQQPMVLKPESLPENRTPSSNTSLVTVMNETFSIENYSSFTKVIRITAYCLRFIRNMKNTQRTVGSLSTIELHNAKQCLIKLVQSTVFSGEIHNLMINKPLPNNSKLLSLHSFIDDHNILTIIAGRGTVTKLSTSLRSTTSNNFTTEAPFHQIIAAI